MFYRMIVATLVATLLAISSPARASDTVGYDRRFQTLRYMKLDPEVVSLKEAARHRNIRCNTDVFANSDTYRTKDFLVDLGKFMQTMYDRKTSLYNIYASLTGDIGIPKACVLYTVVRSRSNKTKLVLTIVSEHGDLIISADEPTWDNWWRWEVAHPGYYVVSRQHHLYSNVYVDVIR